MIVVVLHAPLRYAVNRQQLTGVKRVSSPATCQEKHRETMRAKPIQNVRRHNVYTRNVLNEGTHETVS